MRSAACRRAALHRVASTTIEGSVRETRSPPIVSRQVNRTTKVSDQASGDRHSRGDHTDQPRPRHRIKGSPPIETPTPSTSMINESGRLNSRSDLRFPYPTERPAAIVLVFDGRCRFCTAQVRWLQRLDWRKTLSFISAHDPAVQTWWPNLTHDQLMAQLYAIPPEPTAEPFSARTQFIGGAAGVRHVAWHLPLLWPVALLLSIPGSLPFWQALYGFVARHRYRLGRLGDACDPDGTCDLHFGDPKKEKN